jgi:biotin synthase
MEPYPESMPINNLVQAEGMPLTGTEVIDPFAFVRTIAIAHIATPRTMVRLAAGREQLDEALQAMCFLAGANSIFHGDQLLTTGNRKPKRTAICSDASAFVRKGSQQMEIPRASD